MRTFLITFTALFIFNLSFSQTYVPDDNFEQELINLGYDIGPLNDYVSTSIVSTITILDVSGKNISDLTGIQDFLGLTALICDNNNLSSLDVSGNSNLIQLWCSDNQLTTSGLNINNPGIIELKCNNNLLTNLDLSSNSSLVFFEANDNQLNNIDISNCGIINSVRLNNNNLTHLYLPNNTLQYLEISNNQLTQLDLTQTRVLELDASNNDLNYLDVRHVGPIYVTNGYTFNNFNLLGNNNLCCILINDLNFPFLNVWLREPSSLFHDNEGDCDLALAQCQASSNVNITVSLVPTRNSVIIKGLLHPSNIYCYDINGYLVLERSNYFEEKIITEELEPGIYFFRIINEEQNVQIKLLLNH